MYVGFDVASGASGCISQHRLMVMTLYISRRRIWVRQIGVDVVVGDDYVALVSEYEQGNFEFGLEVLCGPMQPSQIQSSVLLRRYLGRSSSYIPPSLERILHIHTFLNAQTLLTSWVISMCCKFISISR